MDVRAILLVLGAAAIHALWNSWGKNSSNPTAFLLAMEISAAVVLVPVLLFGVPVFQLSGEIWLLVAATAVLHALYAVCLGGAYRVGDLSVVYPVVQSTPALAALLAWPLLGERPSVAIAVGIAVVMIGVWLLGSEGTSAATSGRAGGVWLALAALAAAATYAVVDKRAILLLDSWQGDAPVALGYVALWHVAYLPIFWSLAVRESPPGLLRSVRQAMPGAAVCGILAIVAVVFVLEALRRSDVSQVASVRQASVPFAAVLAAAHGQERMTLRRLAGIGTVVTGISIVTAG